MVGLFILYQQHLLLQTQDAEGGYSNLFSLRLYTVTCAKNLHRWWGSFYPEPDLMVRIILRI